MKEAAGEANMTVVTIVLIAAIVAIATPIITRMMKSIEQKTCCTNEGGIWTNGSCSIDYECKDY
ncbi:MAG: hypothetical protein IJ565_03710 [Bacilli bacterium]|nr:hypothetical protein [Bacilli bacterium]